MTKNFEKEFDNFLTERMGEDIARLRKKNEKYKAALIERSELIHQAQIGKIDDYRQAFNRLGELGEYIRDVESRYLYYAGMAVHKKMDDVISSSDLLEMFTE